MEYKFDPNRADLNNSKPEFKERTNKRLLEIANAGMQEVGSAEFGIPGIVSGLYIEKVWNDSDEEFTGYLDWVKEVVNKRTEVLSLTGIRALSWKEPFATAMLFDKVETRTWHTNYRGPVLICASKVGYTPFETMDITGPKQSKRLFEALEKSGLTVNPGNAIAVGRLVSCRQMTPEDEDTCFVKYHKDLWCHVYDSVKRIAPFAFKGTQGWKILDESVTNNIIFI